MTPAALSRRLALSTLCASALGLAGCGGSSSSTSGTARIRAINLSTDLASVDLFADDDKIFSAVNTDAVADYVGIDSGTYTMKIKRAGDGAALLNGSYSLVKDKHYLAVVWGRETALRLSTLPEDEDAANITTGNTRVRIFNATTDTGAVDVFLTTANADLGETAATQSSLGSGTLSGFRDLSAATYRLRVTGVGNPDDVRLDIPAVTLGDKEHATLVLTAGASGMLVNGTLIVQQGSRTTMKNTKARMRVVAGVDGAANINVSVAGTTLSSGLRSPNVGPYALVDAGDLNLVVRAGGSVISDTTQTFVAGTDYTVMAYGAVGAGQVKVLIDDNRLPTTTTRVKVRLVHGAEGTDPLTLSVDYLVLVSDLAAGNSAYATTNASTSVRIDVAAATAATNLAPFTEVNLQGQSVYSVFVLGGAATPTPILRKER